MSESKSEACVKYPTFDGKDENWPFYKKKMESYLARLDLSDLLTGKITIPKDNAVGSDDKEKIEFDEKRSKNRKAAGTLLNSIDSSTEEGKAAFFLIERYHDADDGCAGGQFIEEWKALTARCETVQVKNLRDQKKDYYTDKMGQREQPSLFVVRLDRMRKDLKKMKHDIDEDDFIQDALGKLPESRDPEKMTPCEVERKLLERRMSMEIRWIDTYQNC